MKNTLQWLSFWNTTSINLQASKCTLAVGNCQGFCRGKQCFYSNHLGKNIAEVIFSSKIYIHFTIFNTYYLTELLFTNKWYHLHMLQKCLYVLEEVRSIIYFRQFIHPLSLRSRSNEVSNSCLDVLIIMILFGKKKIMPEFGHMP